MQRKAQASCPVNEKIGASGIEKLSAAIKINGIEDIELSYKF